MSSPRRVLSLHQLFAVTIIPLAILVLIISLGSTYLHQQSMRSLVGQRDALATRAAAGALDSEINHRIAAIHGLALRATDSPDSLNEVLVSSGYLLSDFDLGLAFISADGRLLVATGQPGYWQALSDQEMGGLKELMSGKAGSESFLLEVDDPASKQPTILIGALLSGQDVVTLGAITVDTLARKTLDGILPANQEAQVFILNAQRKVLFHSGASGLESNLDDHPGVADVLQGKSGTIYIEGNGEEHVVAYSPVRSVGWALVVEEPWQTVTTSFLRTTEIAPLALVPVLLIALAGLWFGVRQIVQPLQALESKAASLAWGDFHAIEEPVGGIAEIRRLQAELSHMARKLQSAQHSLRGYIGAITTAQEEERRRLARELHDDTIQALIALKQRVQIAQKAPRDGKSARALKEIESLTEETIVNLRRLTRDLRPIYLEDLGLVTALEMLARETSQVTGIEFAFRSHGEERRLPAHVELALYRMAQEALSNIARHARASHAILRIDFSEDSVVLQALDDGQGFEVPKSPAEFVPAGHFGLLGLHERAELIGANLQIRSSPGNGTHLTIVLPVKESAEAQVIE